MYFKMVYETHFLKMYITMQNNLFFKNNVYHINIYFLDNRFYI